MTEQTTQPIKEGEIYEQLAQHLDALPNRFPSTESGVELLLLATLFSPEEAGIALSMGLKAETAGLIAAHAETDPKKTRDTLKRMVAKGLIEIRKGEGEFGYALKPFVVGFYEGQLPRMNAEMAAIFERYFHETMGSILRPKPSLHRVIPVSKAIPFHVEIHPYERAGELLEHAQSWGVRDCICRKQQHLLGKGCSHPVETCLVFSPIKNAFDRSSVDRAITKSEAMRILESTEEAGLVHSSGNYRDGIDYICNCCTCCCGIMRGITEYGILTSAAHSDFIIAAETGSCTGCADCLERCQFNALAVSNGVVVADDGRCMGCGLCVLVCPTEALHLERRQGKDVLTPPATIEAWRTERTTQRLKKGFAPPTA
jgi:electron transport complex protein RnfB